MKKVYHDFEVLTVLQEVVSGHVKHYQSDFDVDKKIFQNAALSDEPDDKYLLWLARPNGTHCFYERDVYVSGTHPHNSWLFYKEQTSDPVTAYAVELTGIRNGKIMGNLYELDYATHYKSVKRKSLPIATIIAKFRDGSSTEIPYGDAAWRKVYDNDFISATQYAPADLDAWQTTLAEARAKRHGERYLTGTIDKLKKQYRLAGSGSAM
jgi:hypothetical protein